METAQNSQTTEFLNQSVNSPFDHLSTALEFTQDLKKYITWDQVGLLTDESRKNLVVLLIKSNEVQASLRVNFFLDDAVNFIDELSAKFENVNLRFLQGSKIEKENLKNISEITTIWDRCHAQSTALNDKQVFRSFLEDYYSEIPKTGRGKDFTVETIRKVMCDSHNRCMFIGCGDPLNIELLTGTDGNFSYKAHNVAASEKGERGIPFLSSALSDDPNNVLLLCDKHHRLIDKVAASDYTAEYLTKMRKDFCDLADNLLDGLSFEPMPVYSILWPVNSHVVGQPGLKEIASCLSFIKARMKGRSNDLCDSNSSYRKNPDSFNINMPDIIRSESEQIIQQTRLDGHKAVLFAFGPMPALIGLGALLGNKSQYIPMLRYRDGNSWIWPKNEPSVDFYSIVGLDSLTPRDDFILCINFTAKPESMELNAQEAALANNAQIIEVNANTMGNGAIPHPYDGVKFSTDLQMLFHKLKSQYQAKRIHLFVCASNAASVFIGQAYDLHHPEIIIYDFIQNGMEPKLIIKNNSKKTELYLP